MTSQSNFIFINNFEKKVSDYQPNTQDPIQTASGWSIHHCIKNAFEGITSKSIKDRLFEYEYFFSIKINGKPVKLSIVSKEVVDSCYLSIIAEGETKVQTIAALEYAQEALITSELEKEYIAIPSYDAVSEYYCNLLYPLLNKVERKLRQLLLNIYTLNFGKDFYQKTITAEIQDKAKRVIRARGSQQKKELQNLKEFFYSLEFGDIQQILFDTRWTEYDSERIQSFLKTNDDLSKLSDAELREQIKNFAPRSDWDRFFDPKFINVNVQGDLEIIRGYRNSIAHCKFLGKEQYTECKKIINHLCKALDSAIQITEETDFHEKNKEYFKEALSGSIERISAITEGLTKSLSEMVKGYSLISESLASTVAKQLSFTHYISPIAEIAKKLVLPSPLITDTFSNSARSFINALTLSTSIQNPPIDNNDENTSNESNDNTILDTEDLTQ